MIKIFCNVCGVEVPDKDEHYEFSVYYYKPSVTMNGYRSCDSSDELHFCPGCLKDMSLQQIVDKVLPPTEARDE